MMLGIVGSCCLCRTIRQVSSLTIKRVYVDKLTGGETAAQMRDLLMSSLQGAKLFIVTENQERADMIMKGGWLRI